MIVPIHRKSLRSAQAAMPVGHTSTQVMIISVLFLAKAEVRGVFPTMEETTWYDLRVNSAAAGGAKGGECPPGNGCFLHDGKLYTVIGGQRQAQIRETTTLSMAKLLPGTPADIMKFLPAQCEVRFRSRQLTTITSWRSVVLTMMTMAIRLFHGFPGIRETSAISTTIRTRIRWR